VILQSCIFCIRMIIKVRKNIAEETNGLTWKLCKMKRNVNHTIADIYFGCFIKLGWFKKLRRNWVEMLNWSKEIEFILLLISILIYFDSKISIFSSFFYSFLSPYLFLRLKFPHPSLFKKPMFNKENKYLMNNVHCFLKMAS